MKRIVLWVAGLSAYVAGASWVVRQTPARLRLLELVLIDQAVVLLEMLGAGLILFGLLMTIHRFRNRRR